MKSLVTLTVLAVVVAVPLSTAIAQERAPESTEPEDGAGAPQAEGLPGRGGYPGTLA